MNGTYTVTATYWSNKPTFYNGKYYIFYGYSDPTPTYFWAIALSIGAPPIQWLTSKTSAGGLPDGNYAGATSGVVSKGAC